ncbi:MAG: hypothetical protein EB059_10850, partial [Alphaproteobacteria bacterium]|nr:hypothetical protein [Alphaproteobacteria bacterium]
MMTCWQALPDIEKLNGAGTFDQNGFDIQVSSGEMGAIKVQPSHMVIAGLNAEIQTIVLDAMLTSPAPALLEVLDRAPMGYAKKMNIKPTETSGDIDGTLHLGFPLLKDLSFDQIDLNADAKVSNGAVQKIAGLIDVTKGNVALQLDKQGMHFEGDATLNDVPANVSWNERFTDVPPGEMISHAVIKGKAKADDIKKFGVALTMHSADVFPVEITYDRGAVYSKLSITGDAANTALEISDVFYRKPMSDPLSFSTVLEWGGDKPMQLSQLKVTGKNVAIDGKGSFDAQQRLALLTLNPLQLDATNVRATFKRGDDGVPSLILTGDVLDMRHAFDDTPDKVVDGSVQTNSGAVPLRLEMQIKRVLTSAKTELANMNVKATRDAFGWAYLDASVLAKNKTPFNASIKPVNGRSVVSITTPNLGNVLASLDVTDTLVGGKLVIDGKSEPNDKLRNMFGHISLENYRVKNMPALAQLISAISPDGFAAMLGGEGLGFSELIGEYVWEKNTIVITKAHTSSGSLGLTMAGKVDLQHSALQLEGQVIPAYFISRILSAIPILGDVLTGGEGQGLFAA